MQKNTSHMENLHRETADMSTKNPHLRLRLCLWCFFLYKQAKSTMWFQAWAQTDRRGQHAAWLSASFQRAPTDSLKRFFCVYLRKVRGQRHMFFRSIVLAEGHFSRQRLFSVDHKPTSLTGRWAEERRAERLVTSQKNHLTLVQGLLIRCVPILVNTWSGKVSVHSARFAKMQCINPRTPHNNDLATCFYINTTCIHCIPLSDSCHQSCLLVLQWSGVLA